jgi:hypothetical protein
MLLTVVSAEQIVAGVLSEIKLFSGGGGRFGFQFVNSLVVQ